MFADGQHAIKAVGEEVLERLADQQLRVQLLLLVTLKVSVLQRLQASDLGF